MLCWTMSLTQQWSVLCNERGFSGSSHIISISTVFIPVQTKLPRMDSVLLSQSTEINNMVTSRHSEQGDSVSFPEMAVMSQPGFICGAYAMRGLIFSCPSRIEVGAYELVKP